MLILESEREERLELLVAQRERSCGGSILLSRGALAFL